jgi:predicted dehydrogenase
MNTRHEFNRRSFLGSGLAAGTALALANKTVSAGEKPKQIRIGVIGCGSVSHSYLPHLSKCPYAELVSVCDIIPERAAAQAKKFNIPNQYPHIDAMLAGAEFDLMVNLTNMQEPNASTGRRLSQASTSGAKKPMANSLAAGQELLETARRKGVRIWGAPAMVMSPHFAFMAKTLAAGSLGRLAAAHADYGHTGPDWSAFFYEKGGGSLPDLAVYNLTTLTGLLGPARSVVAMTSVVLQSGRFRIKGRLKSRPKTTPWCLWEHKTD